jgi:SRSO17 transposase
MPGQRKSIEPMAARLGVDSQQLRQFLADSPWDDQELWRVVRRDMLPHCEHPQAWIVDSDRLALNRANIQSGWPVSIAGPSANGPIARSAWSWCSAMGRWPRPWAAGSTCPKAGSTTKARCAKAGVPPEVGFATKPQIALALIEQALADGVAPAPVLADAAYGNGFAFRERLRQRQLEFFLQVTPKNTWAGPKRCPPSSTVNNAPSSRPSTYRRRVICWTSRVLAAEAWKACSWKAAGGKRRRTRLAWQEVYLARGLKEPPGQLEKLWLVVDWPEGASEPYHCYLAHLHRVPSKARCLTLSRSRWHVEHYLQRSKDYLGFDHYEAAGTASIATRCW